MSLQKKKPHQHAESSAGNRYALDNSVMAGGEIHTISIQLDFPTFNGENPNAWLYKVNQFFSFHNTLPQHRLCLISFHMKGKALTWFQNLDESSLLGDWDTYVKALLLRFGPNYYDDPMEALTLLHQTEIVKAYKTPFENLSN